MVEYDTMISYLYQAYIRLYQFILIRVLYAFASNSKNRMFFVEHPLPGAFSRDPLLQHQSLIQTCDKGNRPQRQLQFPMEFSPSCSSIRQYGYG
jgi:hypothetical protein